MAPHPFSLFAFSERVESVIGAIQTSLAMVPDRPTDKLSSNTAATELAAWRAHRPYIQHIVSYPRYSHSVMEGRDSHSSADGMDGSETLVSTQSAHTYYALPESPKVHPAHVLGGKIITDIASFERQLESGDDSDNDTFYSYSPDSPTGATIPHRHPAPTCFTGPSSDRPNLAECVTALSPPPLWHAGKTRSKVVFTHRETPGTCPAHSCADCGLCDDQKPLLFTV